MKKVDPLALGLTVLLLPFIIIWALWKWTKRTNGQSSVGGSNEFCQEDSANQQSEHGAADQILLHSHFLSAEKYAALCQENQSIAANEANAAQHQSSSWKKKGLKKNGFNPLSLCLTVLLLPLIIIWTIWKWVKGIDGDSFEPLDSTADQGHEPYPRANHATACRSSTRTANGSRTSHLYDQLCGYSGHEGMFQQRGEHKDSDEFSEYLQIKSTLNVDEASSLYDQMLSCNETLETTVQQPECGTVYGVSGFLPHLQSYKDETKQFYDKIITTLHKAGETEIYRENVAASLNTAHSFTHSRIDGELLQEQIVANVTQEDDMFQECVYACTEDITLCSDVNLTSKNDALYLHEEVARYLDQEDPTHQPFPTDKVIGLANNNSTTNDKTRSLYDQVFCEINQTNWIHQNCKNVSKEQENKTSVSYSESQEDTGHLCEEVTSILHIEETTQPHEANDKHTVFSCRPSTTNNDTGNLYDQRGSCSERQEWTEGDCERLNANDIIGYSHFCLSTNCDARPTNDQSDGDSEQHYVATSVNARRSCDTVGYNTMISDTVQQKIEVPAIDTLGENVTHLMEIDDHTSYTITDGPITNFQMKDDIALLCRDEVSTLILETPIQLHSEQAAVSNECSYISLVPLTDIGHLKACSVTTAKKSLLHFLSPNEENDILQEESTDEFTRTFRQSFTDCISERQALPIAPITEFVDITSEQQNELICTQQKELKQKYLDLVIGSLPWMNDKTLPFDDYYVDIKLIKNNAEDENIPFEETTLHKLFDSEENKKHVHRILLEGEAGSGKTTLLTKIAHDWAKNEKYVAHFDLLFVLHLNDFKGNFEDMIIGSTGVTESERCILLSILNDKSKNVLILIDGVDELPNTQENSFVRMLSSELPNHVTLVVTSRSRKQATNSFTEKYTDFTNSENNAHDKTVFVKGLTTIEEQLNFVKKYTRGISDEKLNTETMKLDSALGNNYMNSPLFLILFILQFTRGDEDIERDDFLTATNYFKLVFNSIVRKYFSRRYTNTDKIDLFADTKGILPLHSQLIRVLGKFALSALTSGSSVFSEEDILKSELINYPAVLEFGILNQKTFIQGFVQSTFYEPVHKTFFEFAAAYYLWIEYIQGHIRMGHKLISSVRPQFKCGDWSFLFPFLVGLCRNKCGELYHMLLSYKAEYSHCFFPIGVSLMQTELNPDILRAIIPFLPGEWRIPWCENDSGFSLSIQHNALVKYGIRVRKIQRLVWCVNQPCSIPSNMPEVPKLEIVVLPSLPVPSKTCCNRLKCIELLCTIRIPDASEDDWNRIVSAIKAISYRCISFSFPTLISLQNMHKFVTSDFFQGSHIHWLCVNNCDNELDLLGLIKDLIQKGKVHALGLTFQPSNVNSKTLQMSSSNVKHIVQASARSLAMRRFVFVQNEMDSPFTINLTELCDYGRRSWSYVHIDGVSVQYTPINSETCAIHCLKLPSKASFPIISRLAKLFKVCKVRSLVNCPPDLLGYFHSFFTLHDTLKELHLVADAKLFHYGLCELVRYFKNLQIVALGLQPFQRDYNKQCLLEGENCTTSCKNFLRLKRLEIWWQKTSSEYANQLVTELMHYMGKTVHSQRQQLKLQYLTLHCEDAGDDPESCAAFLSLVYLMKKTLTRQLVPQVQVICSYDFSMNVAKFKPNGIASWFDMFAPSEGFVLERHIWGAEKEDSIWGRETNNVPNINTIHIYTVTRIPAE